MLIYGILSRLDVQTIITCKCVCKTFLKILTDPYFIQLHLTKAPNADNCLVIFNRWCKSEIFLVFDCRFGLENQRSEHAFFNSRLCQTLVVPQWTGWKCYWLTIQGSCNGLLCVRYNSTREYMHRHFICNPVLGEFVAHPPHVEYPNYEYTGFGFCSKTKQYKVFRFEKRSSICMIHTLGTDCWRKTENIPLPKKYGFVCCSLNGNLYWLTKDVTPSKWICSFNIETEQHSYISAPTDFFAEPFRKITNGCRTFRSIGLLEGLLCFSYQIEYRFEVFVMKDNGVNGCWTKELSVDLHSNFKFRDNEIVVCRFFNNGDLVVDHHFMGLFCWNLRTGSIWKITSDCGLGNDVISFVPNFTSLKDIAGGHVEFVQRRKMRGDLWSRKGFRFIYS